MIIRALGTIALAVLSASAAFVHPGLLHTNADFTRIKGHVDKKEQPWLTGWNKLIANPHAQTVRPRRQCDLEC